MSISLFYRWKAWGSGRQSEFSKNTTNKWQSHDLSPRLWNLVLWRAKFWKERKQAQGKCNWVSSPQCFLLAGKANHMQGKCKKVNKMEKQWGCQHSRVELSVYFEILKKFASAFLKAWVLLCHIDSIGNECGTCKRQEGLQGTQLSLCSLPSA